MIANGNRLVFLVDEATVALSMLWRKKRFSARLPSTASHLQDTHAISLVSDSKWIVYKALKYPRECPLLG